jgi:hypothetical protein
MTLYMSTKHHYVPKFYLKGFLDPSAESYLWVVDMKEQSIERHAPKNIAYLTGYYDVDKIGNDAVSNKSMFENMLSAIESKASSVIHRIRKDDFNLTLEDRFNLSNFIGLQLGRVPSYRDYIAKETIQFYEQRLIDLISNEEKLKREFGEDVAGFKAYALSIRDKIIPKKDFPVSASLKIGVDFAELVFGMTWVFLFTKSQSKFFTSDNPVSLLSDNKPLKIEFGGINTDLEIAFPISPSCALLAHNHDRRNGIIVEIDSDTVDKLNWKVFHTISRYIFCSTQIQAKNLLGTYNIAKSKGFPKEQ